MWSIPDDPIVSCIERTGYPSWYFRGGRMIEDDYDEYDDCEICEEDEEELEDGEGDKQIC